jgi:hypothetical protein
MESLQTEGLCLGRLCFVADGSVSLVLLLKLIINHSLFQSIIIIIIIIIFFFFFFYYFSFILS